MSPTAARAVSSVCAARATARRTGAARALACAAVVLCAAALGGCATLGDALTLDEVKPWQRDVLARDDMQLVSDPMDDAVDDHLYFSREASTGGGSVRGGGCGCN